MQTRETAAKPSKLIVLAAFDYDDEGMLKPAFEARQMPSEASAINRAKLIALNHAGVIAWSRDAAPDVGEYGEPVVLYQRGDVPDME